MDFKDLKILCSICARAGSKGVKNKNIKIIAGKPLISYTIQQAKLTNIFQDIAVSSDSDEILFISMGYGASVLIKRPTELAKDNSAKLPAIRHCLIEAERIKKTKYDIIVDLDATSPLRNPGDITNSIIKLMEEKAGNLITAAPSKRSPYFNMVEEKNGKIQLIKELEKGVTRRQDSPRTYDMNASIYIWKRETLLNYDSIFLKDTALYVMPEERSIDIDSQLDFEFVEFLLEKRNG